MSVVVLAGIRRRYDNDSRLQTSLRSQPLSVLTLSEGVRAASTASAGTRNAAFTGCTPLRTAVRGNSGGNASFLLCASRHSRDTNSDNGASYALEQLAPPGPRSLVSVAQNRPSGCQMKTPRGTCKDDKSRFTVCLCVTCHFEFHPTSIQVGETEHFVLSKCHTWFSH